MQRRTARTLQRLTLVAGLCCGAWAAAEAISHDSARADDVVPASTELGTVEAGTAPLPAPAPTPSALPEQADQVRGAIEDTTKVTDVVLPETPEPAAIPTPGGDPQPPAEVPPAPAPTDPPADVEPEPAVEPTEPAPAEAVDDVPDDPADDVPDDPATVDDGSAFGGTPPSRWSPDLTDRRGSAQPCDGRDDRRSPHERRLGTEARDRLISPSRGSAGLGSTPPLDPCGPPGPIYDEQPAHPAPVQPDPTPATVTSRGVGLDLDLYLLGPPPAISTAPASREDPWPPGPG